MDHGKNFVTNTLKLFQLSKIGLFNITVLVIVSENPLWGVSLKFSLLENE